VLRLVFKPLEIPAFLEAVAHCLEEAQTKAPLELEIREPGDVPVPVPLEDPPAAPDLPVLLEKLRLKSGASALLLFGSNQDLLDAAGSLPAELDLAALIPPLGGVLSASARLSACLGKPLLDNLLIFRGTPFDLYLAPIGSRGCLAAFKAGPDSQYPAAMLRKISRAAVLLAPFVPDGSTIPPSNGEAARRRMGMAAGRWKKQRILQTLPPGGRAPPIPGPRLLLGAGSPR
jgi:hypothetical protein